MQRRATCCGGVPSSGPVAECERNLSGALADGAVTLADTEIARCADAVARSVEGCDWVAPFPVYPPTPPECLGLLKGNRALGESCRSSLECTNAGHCAGAGPTTPGTCQPPRATGPCGALVDVLATYVRDSSVAEQHPECTGRCVHRQCSPSPAVEATAPPPRAPLSEGSPCTSSAECRAQCVRTSPTDAAGTCRAQCVGVVGNAEVPASIRLHPRRPTKQVQPNPVP